MLTLVDYGAGNLFSLASSLDFIGETCEITDDPEKIASAERIILPGVGAFGDATEALRRRGLDEALKDAASRGTPLLGICLGMQLLFERSFEYGEHEGLGLIGGEIVPLSGYVDRDLKIPHMGWNALHFTEHKNPHGIFRDVAEGEYVYFVHSYFARGCDSSTEAVCDYGGTVTAAVSRKNVCGCQFHPEKSSQTGLKILRAFAKGDGIC